MIVNDLIISDCLYFDWTNRLDFVNKHSKVALFTTVWLDAFKIYTRVLECFICPFQVS